MLHEIEVAVDELIWVKNSDGSVVVGGLDAVLSGYRLKFKAASWGGITYTLTPSGTREDHPKGIIWNGRNATEFGYGEPPFHLADDYGM